MSSRSGTAVALGLVIAVVLGGAIAAAATHRHSGDHGHAQAPVGTPSVTSSPSSAATSAAPTAASTPSPSATPAPPNTDLFTPPVAFHWVPDTVAGTGSIDAAQAAALDGTGTLSKVGLEQLGFRRGVSRQWDNGTDVLVDLVYTFATPAGARAYVNSTAAARRADPTFSVVATPVGSPAGAVALTNTADGSRSLIELFASETHAVVIGLVQAGDQPDPALLATLSAAQAAQFSAP